MKPKSMTKTTFLLATLLALPSAFGQSPPPPAASTLTSISRAGNTPEPALTKFSLDFPGGSPKQLVAAIEKATGKPLNAIIPPEHAEAKLPSLKMNNVNVQQLFTA